LSTETIPEIETPGDLGDEIGSFFREKRSERISPNTIATYGAALRMFTEFLLARGYPTALDGIRDEHVTAWLNGLHETVAPATVHNRFRALKTFFTWYGTKVDGFLNPMRRMRPPRLPKYEPRVLSLDELRAVLGTCRGKAFDDVRDAAILRVFMNTGMRRSELTGLRYSPTDLALRDVNLNRGEITVYGKGEKSRICQIDNTTVVALEAYLRVRRAHDHASEPWLWLGLRGRLTDSGIGQLVRARGQLAGIGGLHPHELRHAWRHHLDMAGADRETLMALGGWESDRMLRRYASTTANSRALAKAREIALGDKL
jgi:site-specific recombinase XerD